GGGKVVLDGECKFPAAIPGFDSEHFGRMILGNDDLMFSRDHTEGVSPTQRNLGVHGVVNAQEQKPE
ncbi:MAG TPA: hypothetical protein PLC09_12500, partial [Holophaga sp.]|nr:hypothetical protein [Holophaga sp.]